MNKHNKILLIHTLNSRKSQHQGGWCQNPVRDKILENISVGSEGDINIDKCLNSITTGNK